jgi:hypothetical protein
VTLYGGGFCLCRLLHGELIRRLGELPLVSLCVADVLQHIRENRPEWLARSDIEEWVRRACGEIAIDWETTEVEEAWERAVEWLEHGFDDAGPEAA